jgi:hypothetical protein
MLSVTDKFRLHDIQVRFKQGWTQEILDLRLPILDLDCEKYDVESFFNPKSQI